MTVPTHPTTERGGGLQHSWRRKTYCLERAEVLSPVPESFLESLLVPFWGQRATGCTVQGCSREEVCVEHCDHNKQSTQGLQGGIDDAWASGVCLEEEAFELSLKSRRAMQAC